MIHVFHGADSYSRHEAIAALRASLNADGMLETNSTTLDARALQPADVMMVCDALPFLGACRWVFVPGLLARAAGERGGRRGRSARPRATRVTVRQPDGVGDRPPDEAQGWTVLAEYATRMPPTTTLVLEDGDIRETNPLLQALKVADGVRVRAFPKLPAAAVQGWVAEQARRRGLAIARPALEMLAASAPLDSAEDGQWHALWSLAGDIEKLSLYAGARTVMAADDERLVPAALESRAWSLADAVAGRDAGRALPALEELLAAGQAPARLLLTLADRYRQLLQVRELLDARVPDGDAARRLGMADWQYRQRRAQAAGHPMARLEAALLRILEADRAIKSGRYTDTAAIELLVADLSV